MTDSGRDPLRIVEWVFPDNPTAAKRIDADLLLTELGRLPILRWDGMSPVEGSHAFIAGCGDPESPVGPCAAFYACGDRMYIVRASAIDGLPDSLTEWPLTELGAATMQALCDDQPPTTIDGGRAGPDQVE